MYLYLICIIICIIIAVIFGCYMLTLNRESFTGGTLDNIYGHGCPYNPYTKEFDCLLRKWHQISKEEDIPYSISYGSYLGWVRHRDYIPYDMDMDVHIGIESVAKLMRLSRYDWCCKPQELSTYPLQIGVPRLLVNPYHNYPLNNGARPRFNCDGKEVSEHTDNCAFNGPIARLMYLNKKGHRLHLDVFVYHMETDRRVRHMLENRGYAAMFYGPYAAYITSKHGSGLPPVKDCTLHGIPTMCFSDAGHFLESRYGPHYLKPDKMWNPSSGEFRPKGP